ncbi:MAG: SURF1 family protein [Anaerolineales bacterium]|nr:SURF1 family protein [Anaerolineales bacterium]
MILSTLRLYFSRQWWWTTLLVFAAVGVMIRLGIWQLDRLSTRRAFNEHVRQMQASAPVDLNAVLNPAELTEMEYRRAYARGILDFTHQIALRNQYWGEAEGIAEHGYRLFTPLILDNGRAVLVDRGWIPAEYADPTTWNAFDVPSPAQVSGIIRLPLARGDMGGGVPDPPLALGETRRIWNYLDLEILRTQFPYDLLPVYLQQAPPSGEQTLPYKALPELELTDGPHLGYALQWFFYAALVFFVYPIYLKQRK